MATCQHCGEDITLEPDANGGERWYHEGDQVHCANSETAAKPEVTEAKAPKGAAASKGGS